MNDYEQLKQMLQATEKCIAIGKDIKNANELKNNSLAHDTIISNLTLINEIRKKISEQTAIKTKIDWKKFTFYAEELLDLKKALDLELILKIIYEELPILREKLKNFLNANQR